MGKRGYDPMEKQSSTMSNRQVIELLKHYNFVVGVLERPVEPKKSVRAAVYEAQRMFGQFAHISNTGESVFFVGNNVTNGGRVNVCVNLSNMLGIGEREALLKATGIPEFAPTKK
jgi:hypothetical protein